MTEQREIQHELSGTEWGAYAREYLEVDDVWSLEEEIGYRAAQLSARVSAGKLSRGDLRAGRAYANALDAETTALATDGDIESLDGADQVEAVARRIANGAGAKALHAHRNHRVHGRTVSEYHASRRRSGIPGMGALERKDML